MSTPLWCEPAWSSRACGDCAHNPINQRGEAKGASIRPKVGKDGKCPHWKARRKVAA